MNKTGWIVIVSVIVIIAAGGIYWATTQNMGTSSMASQATATATTTPSASPTIILRSNTQFPSYLAAANGMALYTFKSDTAGVSNCSGACAAAWPPYTIGSASGLSAGTGITGTIGTITRSDGMLQVTYNGMPLYFFVQDTSVGDVTGDGQSGFSIAVL